MTDKEILDSLNRQFFFAGFMEQDRQNKLISAMGVGYNVYRSIWYINDHPEGVEPSAMASDLLVTRQTMTSTCDQLEKNGLINRTINPEDRRRILITLTDEGKDLAKKINAVIDCYHRKIIEQASREDLEAYVRLRKKFCDIREVALEEALKEIQPQ